MQAQQRGMTPVGPDGQGNIVVGYAYFKDLARGRLSGDPHGFLKIITRVGPWIRTSCLMHEKMYSNGICI